MTVGQPGRGSEVPVIARRIERLFEVVRPDHDPRRQWRNSEVVTTCREAGREMSESHLSELRRGIKTNPTLRVLETIAWFFDVRVAYFTDDGVAEEVNRELARREAETEARRVADHEAAADQAAAARDLQSALRRVGATKSAHRGFDSAQARERASMMRALARALEDSAGSEDGPHGRGEARSSN